MEEKVAMSGQQTEEKAEEKDQQFDINKVPREELVNVITQQNQQLKWAQGQINELRMRLDQVNGVETRLHYLFKVLENRNAFQDSDYIITVCDEIKDILTIKEEPKEETRE